MDLQEFIFYLVWKFDITRFTAFWIYKKKFAKENFCLWKSLLKPGHYFFLHLLIMKRLEHGASLTFTRVLQEFYFLFLKYSNSLISSLNISVISGRNHQISKNYYTGPALPYLVLLKSLIWANFKISLEITCNGCPCFDTFLGH